GAGHRRRRAADQSRSVRRADLRGGTRAVAALAHARYRDRAVGRGACDLVAVSSQLTAHGFQLTAHGSQLAAYGESWRWTARSGRLTIAYERVTRSSPIDRTPSTVCSEER